MKVQVLFFVIFLCMFVELPVLITSFMEPYEIHQTLPDSSVIIAYNRSTEIEKHCSSLLTSASELKPDDNRGSRLKNELSFHLGDWEQENDGAPLIQLDDDRDPDDRSSLLKLASFEVIDVNSIQQLKNTVSLGGVLSIGISRDSYYASGVGLDPGMIPGLSVLKIAFEGVYMETEENGGERLMCLVGSSTSNLPSTGTCSCNEFSDSKANRLPSPFKRSIRFLQDDQVLLVVRYPKIFRLTERVIRGELMSLNEQGGSRHYFSKVHITSQLSGHSKYQFSSELFMSRTFDPPPYQDELMEDGVQMLTGGEFCRVMSYAYGDFPSVAPNYRFNRSYKNPTDGTLGPFVLREEMQAAGGLAYEDIKLIFQHVTCEQDTNRTGNAKVSAVLRAVTKGSFPKLESLRTGLSEPTLAAEGIWNSSSGQLLMVGCQGTVGRGFEGCDYVIAMYFPLSLSIKQRSYLFGTITDVKNDIAFDNPLYFNVMKRLEFRDFTEYVSYNYSKIELVNAFERRTLPYRTLNHVKQWLFRYPRLKGGEEPLAQLGQLSRNLALEGYVVPDNQLIARPKSRVLIQIRVLSLHPLFGCSEHDLTSCRFLNVSMHLMFKSDRGFVQTTYKNFSELSLEGVYDTNLGEMHLIGCRKALIDSIDIERGQDCLIAVEIQYPPLNLQWRENPTAKITISSQRQEDDPLYFTFISIHAHLTHHPGYLEADRAYVEAIVCILMLTVSIAIIRSQLVYMKVNANVVPYISTSMLALQALGYSLPFICGTKVLSRDRPSSGKLRFLECFENTLLLVALLLTARILQLVKESKSKLRHGSREKMVMLSTMAIYTCGFLILLVARDRIPDVGHGLHRDRWKTWMVVTYDLVYFLQDFFLIPQIISNGLMMQMPVKSLKETYYFGFTSVRLLLQYFYHITGPVLHDKVDRFGFSSSSSTPAMLPKVAAPMIMIISAIIVYIQQKWEYQKHIMSPK